LALATDETDDNELQISPSIWYVCCENDSLLVVPWPL